MTLTFDQNIYSKLLAEIAPKVIETEKEYEEVLALVERLTFTKNRTPEEQFLYRLLVLLIEAYEIDNYPISRPEPFEILQHIIEVSGTCQSDLINIIGSSDVVSEVVNGKRSISQAQAKALGDYFQVSPSLFISTATTPLH